jgi:ketosteroid isomerase-like protein
MAKRTTARASPEVEKLKAANLAYYKALSARDIRAMAQVWTCAANNILIAPPENPRAHVGWTAIKRNWERYWPTFDQFSVSMKVNKINISGPVAGFMASRKRVGARRRAKLAVAATLAPTFS